MSWGWKAPALLLLAMMVVAVLASDLAVAEPAPMVDPPTGAGPRTVGWTYANVQTTTKAYATPVKVYYPATSAARDAAADNSSAPYPTVLFLPGAGGTREDYNGWLSPLASWGFVVMTASVNWNDFPNSCNPRDIGELLDWLEAQNATGASRLLGMVDSSRYGAAGHSAGGALACLGTASVPRISAYHGFAPALGNNDVDSIAGMWGDQPVLCQIGKNDANFIAASQRIYSRFDTVKSRVEITGGTHTAGFQGWVFFSFFLHHLAGEQGYDEFLYGTYAVDRMLDNTYDLFFSVSTDVFFPPVLRGTVDKTTVDMREPVTYRGTISGYWFVNDTRGLFHWDVDNDGTPDHSSPNQTSYTHEFLDTGEFYATFRYVMGRLSATMQSPVLVTVRNVPPVAGIKGGDRTAKQDATVSFDGSASTDTPLDRDALQYMWEFGDGDMSLWSSSPTTTHVYKAAGIHLVRLTVKDRAGAHASAYVNVTVVNVPPVARAGADTIAKEDATVAFEGEGDDTPSDRTGLSYRWDFGDGTSSQWASSGTASHAYARSGLYNATLTVKDASGATADDKLTVRVTNEQPAASIDQPRAGQQYDEDVEVRFSGAAMDTSSDLATLLYRWDFGDGQATGWGGTTNATQRHTFTASGSFRVVLTVKDDDGALSSREVLVKVVNKPPTVSITRPGPSATVDEDEPLTFEGMGRDSPTDESMLVYLWEIGNERIDGRVVNHTFRKDGTYVARLTVTDPEGTWAEGTVSVRVVNVAPRAQGTVAPKVLMVNGSINFTGEGEDTPSDVDTLIFSWDFDDGVTSAVASGSHRYTRAGNYTITLTVRDDDGDTDMLTFTVRVDAPPAPPPPPLPPPVDDGDEGGIPLAAVIGGGMGLALLVAIAAVLLVRRRRASPAPAEGMEHAPQPLAAGAPEGAGPQAPWQDASAPQPAWSAPETSPAEAAGPPTPASPSYPEEAPGTGPGAQGYPGESAPVPRAPPRPPRMYE